MTNGVYVEKLLPHDLDAEEAVIGAALIDPDAVHRMIPIVKGEDFFRETNLLCFEACLTLAERGEAVDQITVARELAHTGQLDMAGGMAYLSHLVSITPTSAHAEHYARLVARAAIRRRLIKAGEAIVALGYDEREETEVRLRQAEEILFQVRQDELQGFVLLREIYDQFLQDRANLVDGTLENVAPTFTGYGDLDELLGGLQRSDLVILGARPAMGKSSLATNIVVHAAKGGATVGVFSLEMGRDQLALRMLASEAEVSSNRLRMGLYTEGEEQRIIDAIGRLSELPIYIDATPLQGTLQMHAKAHQLSRQQGLDLLVVDYLQLVQGRGPREKRWQNRVEEVSEVSRALKGLARGLNVPVLTCCQLNRQLENRPGHRPQLSDLRDSGSIEQDADTVMFIHREDAYYTEQQWNQDFPDRPYPKNIAEVIVAKHRHGPVGSIKLYFQADYTRFENLERVE
mgnify:CR=1 FL=1